MKTVRCFLAINIELKTARKLAEIQQTLIGRATDNNVDVKWVPPQNVHVTMRFLGKITEPMISAIRDHMEDVTRQYPRFTMEAKSLGTFFSKEDSGRPSVLFANVESNDDALNRFYQQVCTVLEETGFKHDDKPFVSHITLGRIASGREADVQKVITGYENESFGESLVSNLVCYRSVLSSEAADYQLLWKLPLRGKKTGGNKSQRPQTESEAPEAEAEPHNVTSEQGVTPDESEK